MTRAGGASVCEGCGESLLAGRELAAKTPDRFCSDRCYWRTKARRRYWADPEHRRAKNARRIANARKARAATPTTAGTDG